MTATAAVESDPLSDLDVAVGCPIGNDPGPAVLDDRSARSPLDAFADAVVPALADAPCFVGFTGGRDSSAVLAAAAKIARERGLAAPIPVTLRYPKIPSANEDRWQDLMVRHVGVDDWLRIDVDHTTGEVDLLCEEMTAAHRRHGLLWPPPLVLWLPMLRAVAGRTLITGVHGDGVFGEWQGAAASRLVRERQRPAAPEMTQLLRPAIDRLRPSRVGAREATDYPWLTPDARRKFELVWAWTYGTAPLRWDRWLAWYLRRRCLRILFRSLDAVAGDFGVTAVNPFHDAGFVTALAHAGGAIGLGDRTSIMRRVFGHLLPDSMVERDDKAAIFYEAAWTEPSGTFMAEWDGEGLDPDVVDHDLLRKEWRSSRPHIRTASLLQQAWLASRGDAE